jgi:hypothetical protein
VPQLEQDRERLSEAQRIVSESREHIQRELKLQELDEKLAKLESLLRAMAI